jgi:hypothetical protein
MFPSPEFGTINFGDLTISVNLICAWFEYFIWHAYKMVPHVNQLCFFLGDAPCYVQLFACLKGFASYVVPFFSFC